jgi:hypothetical protein
MKKVLKQHPNPRRKSKKQRRFERSHESDRKAIAHMQEAIMRGEPISYAGG